MNRKNCLTKTLLFLSMIAIAAPVWAVNFYSTTNLERFNTGGTSFEILTTSSDHFCYLGRVGMREIDTAGERAMCNVRQTGPFWILEASIGPRNSDNDVFCTAICYNN